MRASPTTILIIHSVCRRRTIGCSTLIYPWGNRQSLQLQQWRFLILGLFRLATGTDIEEYAVDIYSAESMTTIGIGPLRSTDTQEGLYISARSLAKIAQLLQGRWRNEQVIPATWVEESTAPRYPTGKSG